MKLSDIPNEASELLEDDCDFVIGVESSGLGMLSSSDDLSFIAGDGMGGCFYRWTREATDDGIPIVYLSQYGGSNASRRGMLLESILHSHLSAHDSWGTPGRVPFGDTDTPVDFDGVGLERVVSGRSCCRVNLNSTKSVPFVVANLLGRLVPDCERHMTSALPSIL